MTASTTLQRILVSTALIAAFAIETRAQNLLQNPGFTALPNPATDWSLTLGASRGTPALSHDGDSYVLMFREDLTPVNGWSAASQTLPAVPDQEWTFSGWGYYPSGMFLHDGDYGVLDITFRTASGATTSTQSPQLNLLQESTWQHLSQTAIAPPGTTEVTLSAMLYHNDTWATGRLYFDDFSAQATPAIPEPRWVCLAWPVVLMLMRIKKRIARG